eukprot:jgi/Ulvmu1/3560/UM166_0014.1
MQCTVSSRGTNLAVQTNVSLRSLRYRSHSIAHWAACFDACGTAPACGRGPVLVQAAAAAPRVSGEGQLFFELALVWQELLGRFAVAREGRAQAQMLLTALKLAIAALRIAPLCPDGRPQAQRAVAVAMLLSDLSTSGVPVDVHSVVAAVVVDGVTSGHIPVEVVHREQGMDACVLVHEVQRIRTSPRSIDVYDDRSAAALREHILSMCDTRAVLVELVCRLDQLQNCHTMSLARQQVLALQVLQVFSPMGHALGLSVVSARLDDLALTVLFGSVYSDMRDWVNRQQHSWTGLLDGMKRQVQAELLSCPELAALGARAHVSTRAKSAYSLMKKLATLSDFSRGGKTLDETYDVLGMRIIIDGRDGAPLPEAAGRRACYAVEHVVAGLWTVIRSRRKDYIADPKPNGYQSLHLAVEVPAALAATAAAGAGAARGGRVTAVEVQVRTGAMHAAAEEGIAAHMSYKSGMDVQQSTRLHEWTQKLMQAFSATEATSSIERWGSDTSEPEAEAVLRASPAHQSHAPSAPVAAESLSLVTRAAIRSSLLQNVPESLGETPSVTAEFAARELFAHLDRNGDGAISIDELQDVLRDLGEDSAAAAVEAQALHAALTDRRGASGHITYADLLSFHQGALSSDGAADSDDGGSSYSGAGERRSGGRAPAWAAATRPAHAAAVRAPLQPFMACGQGHRAQQGRRRGRARVRARAREQQVQEAQAVSGTQAAGQRTAGQRTAGARTLEAPLSDGKLSESELPRPLLPGDLRNPGDDSSYRWTDPNAVQWDVPLDQLEQERAELEAVEADMPEEQRGFLDRINLDTIPGGLDSGSWQAADVVQMAGRSARMLRSVAPYKLTLDEGAVDCLDNVLGALLLRDGQTALAVPAHGPLVLGAIKFRGCDVVLDEPRMSGRHVFFEAIAGPGGMRLTVTDMGSTNGVYVNGVKLAPWSPTVIDAGDVVVLGAREFARFQVEPINKADLKEASTIAALVDDLKALRYHVSDKAWRVNKRQRLALGCLRHPNSQLTRDMLASSGTPPVAETLPRTSLAEVATAAVPIAVWNTRNRDDLVRGMLRKGDAAPARSFLHRLAVNYPTDPRTWIALAELRLFYDADYAGARVRCRAAIEALNISESQLQSIVSLGHDHSDKMIRLGLIRVHALTTFALTEVRARVMTPARRLFRQAEREAMHCGLLAMQYVFWSWADCELQQGNAAMAMEVLKRGLAVCKTPALVLLLAKAELKTGKKSRATKRMESLCERFPGSAAAAFVLASVCLDAGTPQRALQVAERHARMGVGDDEAGVRAALQTCEARALVALGQLDAALERVQAAVENEQRSVHVRMQSHEFHPWRIPEEARQALKEPHLVVHSCIRAVRHDFSWVREEVSRAQLAVAEALIPQDPQRAYSLARDAVGAGKLQLESHCVAAQAALEYDASTARPHLMAALRLDGNDVTVLRLYSAWAEMCGNSEGAAAVELLTDELQRLGKGRVPVSVQAAAHDTLDTFLTGS